ncbi:MAG: PEP-CTERM sorting domain-containing protein [Nitrospiraceae bacterium]|nr:MAG: PEP-CTERM sorting domain-containing protein [Nitrospiraceae bacterium]
MMMRAMMKRYSLLVGLFVMLWATETMAYTIGFSNLGGSNLSTFTSYTDHGYTVKATGGQWLEAHVFGSSIPAIVAGPIYHPGESQITVTEGGERFTFQGLDLTSNVAGGTSYTIAGFLGGVEVLSTSVVISSINTFNTFDMSPADSLVSVDRVTITGTPGRGTTSFNIDNIRAGLGDLPPTPRCDDPNGSCQSVPEPASIMLLGAGLVGIEIWRRRRGLGCGR